MYRMICCDMDETLLSSQDKKVSARNRAAIKRVREQGVRFVPTTGRGLKSIQGTLAELGMSGLAGEYVISLNGGAITELGEEKLLRLEALPRSLAEELFARGRDYGLCMQVHTKDETYFYHLTPAEREYLSGRMEMEEFFTPDLDFLAGQEIVKIVYADPNVDHLREIEAELAPLLGEADVSYSSGRFLEFNRKGVTKGQGLLWLASYLGIKPEETIAIGDNLNDVPMLQAAGLGVCVQNGLPEVQKLCGYVTKGTNDEDAVAETIEKFVFSH